MAASRVGGSRLSSDCNTYDEDGSEFNEFNAADVPLSLVEVPMPDPPGVTCFAAAVDGQSN
jgi:hypothetical protein